MGRRGPVRECLCRLEPKPLFEEVLEGGRDELTARRAIDRVLRERPGIGDAYLFPNRNDASQPISRHRAARWLRRAEKLAEVEPLQGSLWHAYRRKWATERKHLPDTDVAEAGGWKTIDTMRLAYQHADPETMFTVVTEPRRLRAAR